jgi:pimeloyl-ACP methyl ester carboxylesterase
VTYDPRGVERSERTDPDLEVTPEVHAADARAVIEAVGGDPVDLFATSGGAVNALALVAAYPGLVRSLVAHEPPAASVLPDATDALAACRAVQETYHRQGWGHGMAHFIALSSLRGPVPADFATQPAPDPAMFGMPTEDDGARDDLLLGSDIVTLAQYRPDVNALRAAPTRIVLAVGADSDEELAHRAAEAVAELLDTRPVTFPGGHGGFLGGEYGQTASRTPSPPGCATSSPTNADRPSAGGLHLLSPNSRRHGSGSTDPDVRVIVRMARASAAAVVASVYLTSCRAAYQETPDRGRAGYPAKVPGSYGWDAAIARTDRIVAVADDDGIVGMVECEHDPLPTGRPWLHRLYVVTS